MISDRAKRLVEALQSWRDLDSAYATAQKFLLEAWQEGIELGEERYKAFLDQPLPDRVTPLTDAEIQRKKMHESLNAWRETRLSEKIAQTRGQNGETE